MADSISAWMTGAVSRAARAGEIVDSHGSHSTTDQLHDAPFHRGSKVQIIRFLGFSGPSHGGARLDESEDSESDAAGLDGVTAGSPGQKHTALWALVGDRFNHVCVKFTRRCVHRFNSTHTRPLLSLRGSVVALKSYRPMVSSRAARLYASEADISTTGPFASRTSSSSSAPRLYLQVESIILWGSINAPLFWETLDLQAQLTSQADDEQVTPKHLDERMAFRQWYSSAAGEYSRERERRAKVRAFLEQSAAQSTAADKDMLGKRAKSRSAGTTQQSQAGEGDGDNARATSQTSSSLSWAHEDVELQATADNPIEDEMAALDEQRGSGEGDKVHQADDPFAFAATEEDADRTELESWRTSEIKSSLASAPVQEENVDRAAKRKHEEETEADGADQSEVTDADKRAKLSNGDDQPDTNGDEWKSLIDFAD